LSQWKLNKVTASVLNKEELEAAYLKIYLRALKLTPEELKKLKKRGYRYAHLEEKSNE